MWSVTNEDALDKLDGERRLAHTTRTKNDNLVLLKRHAWNSREREKCSETLLVLFVIQRTCDEAHQYVKEGTRVTNKKNQQKKVSHSKQKGTHVFSFIKPNDAIAGFSFLLFCSLKTTGISKKVIGKVYSASQHCIFRFHLCGNAMFSNTLSLPFKLQLFQSLSFSSKIQLFYSSSFFIHSLLLSWHFSSPTHQSPPSLQRSLLINAFHKAKQRASQSG